MEEKENDKRDWSVLPDEIWAAVGGCLGNRIDVLRFRSVCNIWRSLVPPFQDSSPLPRFTFPFPPYSTAVQAFVSETTVYRIDRPPPPHQDPSPSSASGWLIKVEEYEHGKMRLLDPISYRRIRDIAADHFPENYNNNNNFFRLSLSDFRTTKITSAYALRYLRGSSSIAGVNKLIVSPNSRSGRVEDCAIFVIYDNGKLGFAKHGEEDITLIDDRILDYNDIILYRGQPYVVDRWGTVSWIDSSLKLIQYSPPMFGFGGRKHLVVSCGELYVVDRYLDENNTAPYPEENITTVTATGSEVRVNFNMRYRHPRRRRRFDFLHPRSIDFKVFKLDEEWGRWTEVKSLGDMAFVLTYDCSFSVLATEFSGFEGNSIYFTEQFDMDLALRRLGRQGGCVFKLEDRTIEELASTPGYSQLLWPTPIPTQLCPGPM